MANYDGLMPGEILADASVAEFIKSLGLGIAEAQKALDENSVNQIAEFIEPREGLGGKTLLDLGLSPAFYHYQHADLQCSLQLSLKVEKDFSLGLNLNGSYNSENTHSGNTDSTETINETGQSTSREIRKAEVEITSASTGTLTVGGQAFSLSGDSPRERIIHLQKALMTSSNSGIARVLYEIQPSSLTITTDAEPEKVEVTDHTVAFIGDGFDNGIIRIGENIDTTYVLDDSVVSVVTEAKSDLVAYATHVKNEIEDRDYETKLIAPDKPVVTAYFETGLHTLSDEAMHSSAFTHMAQMMKREGIHIEIEGFADRQTYSNARSDELNKDLGNKRAGELFKIMRANGAPENQMTIKPSEGDAAAEAAGDDIGQDNREFRKAQITTRNRTSYWLFVKSKSATKLENVQPDRRGNNSTTNGFVYLYDRTALALTDKKVVIDSSEFPFRGAAITGGAAAGTPQAYAKNLADDINSNTVVDFQASVLDNIVTVTKNGDKFQLTLVTAQQRHIEMTATSGITVTQQFTRSITTNRTRQNTGNRAVAVGASLDVRFSRKFEMNVTGNSSISARLVSIPAPPQFLETIKEFLKED